MAKTIEDVLQDFEAVQTIAHNGLQLAQMTKKTISNIDNILLTFEAGMQDESWAANVQIFSGPEGLELAQNVYVILKETKEKLAAVGACQIPQ